MMRLLAQILMGLMLLFGFLTLIPKAYIQFKYGEKSKGILYTVLGLLAVFFSCMAFYYAYLQIITS
jgi:hypothetical protein